MYRSSYWTPEFARLPRPPASVPRLRAMARHLVNSNNQYEADDEGPEYPVSALLLGLARKGLQDECYGRFLAMAKGWLP